MTRARWRFVIVWSLDGLAAVAKVTSVVVDETHHAALAGTARAVAALAQRAAAAVRGQR